jgi:hypothetical protein
MWYIGVSGAALLMLTGDWPDMTTPGQSYAAVAQLAERAPYKGEVGRSNRSRRIMTRKPKRPKPKPKSYADSLPRVRIHIEITPAGRRELAKEGKRTK